MQKYQIADKEIAKLDMNLIQMKCTIVNKLKKLIELYPLIKEEDQENVILLGQYIKKTFPFIDTALQSNELDEKQSAFNIAIQTNKTLEELTQYIALDPDQTKPNSRSDLFED